MKSESTSEHFYITFCLQALLASKMIVELRYVRGIYAMIPSIDDRDSLYF